MVVGVGLAAANAGLFMLSDQSYRKPSSLGPSFPESLTRSLSLQGRVRLESLSLDRWLPTTNAVTLIAWACDLFSAASAPDQRYQGPSDAFSRFSREVQRHIASFLAPADLCSLGGWGWGLVGSGVGWG
jgi:hypothetical protein